MDIKSLKDKILQLAIQGKLVPQNENDEPASILLEKIKAEKEQLIKDKVIKKEKPLPEISEEEKSFDLPKGWEWCRLGEIGIYKKGPFGSTITKSMFVPKGKNTVKVYEQKNAIQKDWTLGEYYITQEYFESKLKGFEVFEGDIIVSCAGTIGETYIMPSEMERGVINQALMKMKIFDGIDINYFLIYFDFILKKTAKESSKGSAIKNIPPFDIFKKMLLSVPPLEEQKRIVAKVDELFELIDELDNNKQELLDSISNTRNKVLQLAIQGKLVDQCEDDEPASVLLERIKAEKQQLIKDKVIKKEKTLPEISDEEKVFDLPKGWEWCRLREISIKVTDGSHNPPKGEDGITDYIMLSSQNINQNTLVNLEKTRYLSEENYNIENKRTQIKIGDILLTIVGTIGRSCIYNDSLNITLQRSVAVIDTKYCNRYLKYLFDSPQIQKYFNKNSSGTAQKGIYLNQLKQTIIPLPPLEEQKRIVEKIDIIMNYLDTFQKEIESQEVILEDILK